MKYDIGDKVRIKSLDWYNKNKDKLLFYVDHMALCFANEIVTIKSYGAYPNTYRIVEDEGDFLWTDEMIEGLVEEETVLNKWTGLKVELELSKTVIGVSNVESLRGERFMSGFVKAIIPPESYQFTDENGNVINATKIVLEKKKKEYPKTYEECCEIVKVGKEHTLEGTTIRINYKIALLESFQKLLICRDAYWKIAGEEMGLGKPWEPDWGTPDHDSYPTITRCGGKIIRTTIYTHDCPFAFPTPEMRDAFKENFDPDIEICKEFL